MAWVTCANAASRSRHACSTRVPSFWCSPDTGTDLPDDVHPMKKHADNIPTAMYDWPAFPLIDIKKRPPGHVLDQQDVIVLRAAKEDDVVFFRPMIYT